MDEQILTSVIAALVNLGTGGVISVVVYYLMSRHLQSEVESRKDQIEMLSKLLNEEREERQRANLRTRSLLVRLAGIKSPDIDAALSEDE